MSRAYSFLLIYSGLQQFSKDRYFSFYYTNQINNRKQQAYFKGVFSPGETITCPQRNFSGHKESCKYSTLYFDQFLEKILLRFDSNGITLNLMNCLFSKDSLQCVFSREGIQPDRSKLQETGKRSTLKNAKNIWIFLTMLNDFHKTIVN